MKAHVSQLMYSFKIFLLLLRVHRNPFYVIYVIDVSDSAGMHACAHES